MGEGFTFLGVTFQRDTWAYNWQGKRIVIANRQKRWLYKHLPEYYYGRY